MGDFNIDTSREVNLQPSYLDTLDFNSFELLIKCPTQVSDTSETCADHVIIRSLVNPTISELDDECCSDHCPILSKKIFGFKTELSNDFYHDQSFFTKEICLKFFF